MTKTIFCHKELARFSEDEFRRDPDGSLHDPLIHETKRPHYANTGFPIEPDPIPGLHRKRGSFYNYRGKSRVVVSSHPPSIGTKIRRVNRWPNATKRRRAKSSIIKGGGGHHG